MLIITAPCWQCNKDMILALMGNESGDFDYGPEKFSESEVQLAEQHGVLLKNAHSTTMNETYMANTCKECGGFIGQWYFFAHYYTPALYGNYKYKIV